MRLFCVVLIGLLLGGCQSNREKASPDLSEPRRAFKVLSRQQQVHDDDYYVLHKSRFIHHKPIPQRNPLFHRKQQSRYQIENDGAPSGPIPSRFKKMTPKQEAISRYGNPDAYEVMGKKYEVLMNPGHYKSRGIASWYGTKFHKERTSSGEKYDMYALTAAHKTLPLPTYIRVKNLENGRVAIVKVNDRGPFHDDRILDLSFAAATKLGVFPKGTAQVEIEALTSPEHPLHYYIQAGAFESSNSAEKLRIQLSTVTPSLTYIQKHNGHYVVQLGPFANKATVEQLKQRLEDHGVHGAFSLIM